MVTISSTDDASDSSRSPSARGLQHPAALTSVAVILVFLYGWTFVVHPDRTAPRFDPAYYSWRIETLISEKPSHLLRITGPFGAFAGGYRVAGTVMGSYLRRIAGVSQLKTTIVLDVTQWVVIALLLGGFAYRQCRDPLIFYTVAITAGGLLLTPPFVGYADNVLCLLFLAAAAWFIPAAAHDWRARCGLGLFLVVAGFTHPTTLAIFCSALIAMTALRLLTTGFDLKAAWRLDGPVLATAAAAVVVTLASWTIGIWGVSESLSAAASPPPKSRAVFIEKMLLWLKEMYPLWNAPLLAIGIIAGIIVMRRRGALQDLSRITIGWLVPFGGVFGFLLGLRYPYYRFFNATLAWVLLIGVGAYVTMRICIRAARREGMRRLALLGVLVVILAIAATFSLNLTSPKWNRDQGGWLSASNKRDLDALRSALERPGAAHRPVIFVVDLESREAVKVYGFAKLSGNISRYGLPSGEIDEGYLYLGSLTKFIFNQPTLTGERIYDRLSRGYLADAERGIEASGKRPIIVLENDFNLSGRNARFFQGTAPPLPTGADLWLVEGGNVITPGGLFSAATAPKPAWWHLLAVVGGLLLLLLPGLIAARRVILRPSLAEMLGIVPALSLALLTAAGIVVLAIVRAPFSGVVPWASLGLSLGVALAFPRRRSARPAVSQASSR